MNCRSADCPHEIELHLQHVLLLKSLTQVLTSVVPDAIHSLLENFFPVRAHGSRSSDWRCADCAIAPKIYQTVDDAVAQIVDFD